MKVCPHVINKNMAQYSCQCGNVTGRNLILGLVDLVAEYRYVVCTYGRHAGPMRGKYKHRGLSR